jgi:MFS family permease
LRRQRRFYAGHCIGFGLLALCGYGFVIWLPTYMSRQFGWSMTSIGLTLAVLVTAAGVVGPILLSFVIDYAFKRGAKAAHLLTYAIIGMIQLVLVVLAMLAQNAQLFLMLATINLCLAPFIGAASASLQIMTPPQYRGQVSAIFMFSLSIFGGALGPSVVALLSDKLFRSEQMLGWAMATTFVCVVPIAVIALLLAAKPMRETIREEAGNAGPNAASANP